MSPAAPLPIEITANDGVVLRGQYTQRGDRHVALFHDEGQDLDVWRYFVADLAAEDFSVVAIDFRGNGMSDGVWRRADALGDVSATTSFVLQRGRLLASIGVGLGASLALAAADRQAPRGLVLIAPLAMESLGPRSGRPSDSLCPRLIIAPSDHEVAAELRAASPGWAAAIYLPVDPGADLLDGEWAPRVREDALIFLRNLAYLDRPAPPRAESG